MRTLREFLFDNHPELTSKEWARRAGIHYTTLRNVLSGRAKEPTYSVFLKITHAAGINGESLAEYARELTERRKK